MSSHNLKLDATAQARAAALVTPVAAAYAAYIAAHPEVTPVTINVAYVETGAVTVGLNFWRPPSLWPTQHPFGVPDDVPTTTLLTPHGGTGVSTISVSVLAADEARAAAIIAALGSVPATDDVLGCACCTGLAILSGFLTLQGPFT